jgi:NADH-quinone oxidoreductase subunit C
MTDLLKELADHAAQHLGVALKNVNFAYGELTLTVAREEIVRILTFLRDDPKCRFTILIDLCGVDYPTRPDARFDVVYHLLSITRNLRVRVKLMTDEATSVPTVIGVHPTANWFEREAFDMYGIPPITGSPAIRCARTSRSPALSRCATTRRRSASSMSR